MAKDERSLLVRRIERGTVLDHIPAGRGPVVLRLLGLLREEGGVVSGGTVVLLMNAPSKKLGRKDVVKIENRFLSKDELQRLALVAPTTTVNLIRDWRVVEKFKLRPPREIRGLLRCPNPRCISRISREPIMPTFELVQERPLTYRCRYCDELIGEDEILRQLLAQLS